MDGADRARSSRPPRARCRRPLSRPLFIYVKNSAYNDNAAVKEYVDFYIENLADIAAAGKFIELSDEQYSETQSALSGIAG